MKDFVEAAYHESSIIKLEESFCLDPSFALICRRVSRQIGATGGVFEGETCHFVGCHECDEPFTVLVV